ncbi:MAG: hypothetical protein HY660_09800 [Armatimonadetes bacterium]|nr:hypothetical protein [Armatimonadota bacterium]
MTVAMTAAVSCAVGVVLVAPQVVAAAQGGLPIPVTGLVTWISRRPFFLLFALLATLAAYWRVR